jgi:hypothetical protein
MAIEKFPQHDSTWNMAQQKQGKERSHTQFKIYVEDAESRDCSPELGRTDEIEAES